MKYSFIQSVKSDYLRLKKRLSGARILFNYSFILCFWYRVCHSLSNNQKPISKIILIFPYLIYSVTRLLTGIQLPHRTKVGKGLCFLHYSCIVIAQDTIIGNNCSIHQGVTLGRSFAGDKAGCPIIGNNVIIFPGLK